MQDQLDYIVKGELRRSHEYFTQIMMNLHCLNLDKCDFFVFTPDSYFLLEVKRDMDFEWDTISRLEKIYMDVILPSLIQPQLN